MTAEGSRASANAATVLAALLDALPACIARLDADGGLVHANPPLLALLGQPATAILGHRPALLLGGGAAAGTDENRVGWVDLPGGQRAYLERIRTPLPAAAGTAGGFLLLVRDLTEQRLREEELGRRTAELEAILGHMAEGVNILDASGRVVVANDWFLDLYDFPRALGRPGTPIEEFTRHRLLAGQHYATEDRRADIEALVAQRAAALKRVTDETFEETRPDGRVIEVRRRRQPDGALISTYSDVTARRAAEAELRRQREALHQAERMGALGSLLAGVAHELNNPLAIILAHATLLEEEADDEAAQGRAEPIRVAAERCARIVSTFLGMARRRPPEFRPVRLRQTVGQALDLVGYGLRASGIVLLLDVADDLPELHADPDQLVQVLVNLIGNARQALAERSGPRRIEIAASAEPDGGMVRVVIADNGPGIPPELRARVFDAFFTTKPEGAGTGVGLSLSRGIVQAHGGSIAAEETPGGGASLVLRLPVVGPAGRITQTNRADTAAERATNAGLRVLVVDDEQPVADVLADILRRDGFAATTETDGRAALARLAHQPFDLVLCDLRMPEPDGAAIYAWIAAEQPALARRFAFVTGDRLDGHSEGVLARTGRPVIAKPFTPAELRRVVRGLLG